MGNLVARLRAFMARRRIPRCWYCRAMVDAKPGWGRYVCNDPACIEADTLETALGA